MTRALAGVKTLGDGIRQREVGRGAFMKPLLLVILMDWMVLLWMKGRTALDWLGDTDMAMRLVQVREFLAGRGWYDLHIPRLAPDEGYVSHWSRLVDAALAVIYKAAALVLPPDQAELAMRLAWPLLMLALTLVAVAFIVRRLWPEDPERTVLVAGLIGALAIPLRFLPGDIDHHGIQIMLVMATWAFLFHADRSRTAAILAGLVPVLALTVALEALPLLVVALAVPAMAFVWHGERVRQILRDHLLGVGAGAALFLALTTPPQKWLAVTACDAFAPNWGLPLMLTSLLGLLLLARTGLMRTIGGRLLLVLGAGTAGAALFVALDPACLKGPFAHVDPRIGPVWLDHVQEMRGILQAPETLPVWVWGAAVLLASAVFMRRLFLPGAHERSEKGTACRFGGENGYVRMVLAGHALAAILALLLSLHALRFVVFLQWLAVPFAAVLALALIRRVETRFRLAMVPVSFTLSPVLALMVLTPLLAPAQEGKAATAGNVEKTLGQCTRDRYVQQLASLPPGLIVAPIDLGPAILARTRHAVLAAPYHRLGESLVTTARIFTGTPEEARPLVTRLQAAYVLVCPGLPTPATLKGRPAGPQSLWRRLLAGDVPPWLESVDLGKDTPLRLYRVRLDKAAATSAKRHGRRAEATPPLRQSIQ